VSFTVLMDGQRAWAAARKLTLDGVCVPSMSDNLFRPLATDSETYRELKAGNGNELGRPGQRYRPKIRSVRSSSVFGLNVFDYWRDHDLEPLAWALEVQGPFEKLNFERKVPHGLASDPPHLDVALTPSPPTPILGIECKFAEPYDIRKVKDKPATLATKYFDKTPGRWQAYGLPLCQRLAEQLGRDVTYHRLNAGQLLKHILGLAHSATNEGRKGRARLLYLWYELDTPEGREHRDEVDDFRGRLGAEVDFRALTIQQLLPRLAQVSEPEYSRYLLTRYTTD
jgi:restriction endonuclease-like protein